MDRIYTPEEIAERLRVSRKAVYDWLNKGRLKGFKAGKMWRVTKQALEDFLQISWEEDA